MIWYLNSKLDLNLSCARDFLNLNSMVTWGINWKRLLALMIFQRTSLKWFLIKKRLAIALMSCNRLHAWWSSPSRSQLISCQWVGLQTLWRLGLRLIYWWDGIWLGFFRAHWGLPVGFLLLRYSVLFTVESLSLLYLLLYLDLYVLGDDALIG